MSVMPAAAASSTAYWMSGLSTTGIISFGLALVTGRMRLPKPATGNTAFLSFGITAPQHFAQLLLIDDRHAEAARLLTDRPGQALDDIAVVRLAHELVDALGELRADALERHLGGALAALLAARIVLARRLFVSHQLGPVGGEELAERAEMARQDLRHLLTDAGDAERVDEARELAVARALDVGEHVRRRLLAHALELGE